MAVLPRRGAIEKKTLRTLASRLTRPSSHPRTGSLGQGRATRSPTDRARTTRRPRLRRTPRLASHQLRPVLADEPRRPHRAAGLGMVGHRTPARPRSRSRRHRAGREAATRPHPRPAPQNRTRGVPALAEAGPASDRLSAVRATPTTQRVRLGRHITRRAPTLLRLVVERTPRQQPRGRVREGAGPREGTHGRHRRTQRLRHRGTSRIVATGRESGRPPGIGGRPEDHSNFDAHRSPMLCAIELAKVNFCQHRTHRS